MGVRFRKTWLRGRCGMDLGLEVEAVPDAPQEGEGPPGGRSILPVSGKAKDSPSSSLREGRETLCLHCEKKAREERWQR